MYVNFTSYNHVENLFARISIFRFMPRNVRAREFKKLLRVLRARYFILVAQGGHTTPSFAYLRHCKKYHARYRQKRTCAQSSAFWKNKSFAARARRWSMAAPYAARISIRKLMPVACSHIVYIARRTEDVKVAGAITAVASRIRKSVSVSAWRVSLW